jgi:hypothetical protein
MIDLLAMDMYNKYGEHAEWKSWNSNPMPTWEELNDAVRSHWIAVAEYVFTEISRYF